eukprot:6195292-Pleurochrysis_carterae.AAC.1
MALHPPLYASFVHLLNALTHCLANRTLFCMVVPLPAFCALTHQDRPSPSPSLSAVSVLLRLLLYTCVLMLASSMSSIFCLPSDVCTVTQSYWHA